MRRPDPWSVPRPSGVDPTALNLDEDPPHQGPRPDRVQAPWGELFVCGLDGYYRARRTDRPLALDALNDKIDRFHRFWQMLRPGVGYRVTGDRVLTLWRNGDGSYRVGHVAVSGPSDGQWLVESGSYQEANNAGRVWHQTHGEAPHQGITASHIQARLRG